MTNILIKAASSLMEKMMHAALVTGVRVWQPATVYEIDLHLPWVDMNRWNTIQRVKCKVGDLDFRDYTPACWDAEEKQCTLYIEAGHDGAGSRWVQQLKPGDQVLLSAVHAAQLPATEGKVLCLSDGSALGHFLALEQLTDREKFPMETAVFLHDRYQIPAHLSAKNTGFEFLVTPDRDSTETLEHWCMSRDLASFTSICIAGNSDMVRKLRRKLKSLPDVRARMYTYGFWS
jgi:NADPH-dependent ferric siderophore reductase